MSCTDEEESNVGTEDSCVGLERCKQEDAPHTALVETQLLNDVLEMGISKEEWAGEHCRAHADMGSTQARNTRSSVRGVITWFCNHCTFMRQ